jgi:PTS system ascorbate-specific IIA component
LASIVIVAHAPLASALQAVAAHAFPECRAAVQALDIVPDMPTAQSALRDLLALHDGEEVLVLADLFGATPCNEALAAASQLQRVRILTGVNVPMLWRALSYRHLPLEAMAERALAGATQGVMAAVATPRQHQPNRPASHDPDAPDDQQ